MAEATNIAQLKAGNSIAEKPKDFPAMLTAWLPEIRRALPKHLNADRMSRIALTAFRRTPKLGECDPRSVFAAVIQAAQLGLEPDTLGRSYLIPYKVNKKTPSGWKSHMECQFVPGWKGLVDLMSRSGQGAVWTGAVFEGDDFDWQLGDSPFVHHKPGVNSTDVLAYVYAVGRVKGQDWPIIDVWPIGKVWKHRDRYNKVGEKHYSFENPEMYARKVPLLQVLKYMPCSAELASAIALNDDAEVGRQNINIQDALEGSYMSAQDITPTGPDADDEALKAGTERTVAATATTINHSTGEITTAPAGADQGPSDADLVAMIKRGEYDEARALAGDKLEMVEGMIKSHEAAKATAAQERPAARRQRATVNPE